jgi:hypothetical protein
MTIENLIEEAEKEVSYWEDMEDSYEKRESIGITYSMAYSSMSYHEGRLDALKEYKKCHLKN